MKKRIYGWFLALCCFAFWGTSCEKESAESEIIRIYTNSGTMEKRYIYENIVGGIYYYDESETKIKLCDCPRTASRYQVFDYENQPKKESINALSSNLNFDSSMELLAFLETACGTDWKWTIGESKTLPRLCYAWGEVSSLYIYAYSEKLSAYVFYEQTMKFTESTDVTIQQEEDYYVITYYEVIVNEEEYRLKKIVKEISVIYYSEYAA